VIRSVAVVTTVAVLGCAAPVVSPTDKARCARPDPVAEAKRAVAALRVVSFKSRPMYDVGAGRKSVTFTPRDAGPDARAVITFPFPDKFDGAPNGFERLKWRSYTYDNALYALWHTANGNQEDAAEILATLAALQRLDGAWGFSFDVRHGSFYNAGYVRTGAVAWVTYAFAMYAEAFDDDRFAGPTVRGAKWLDRQVDAKTGLLRGGSGRWIDGGKSFEPGYVADWSSTEHNVDAYFAFKALRHAGFQTRTDPAALATLIAARLYLQDEGRYAQGLQPTGHDRISALDAAGTWTALFDVSRGANKRAVSALAWVDRVHGVNDGGWRGYKPYQRGPNVWFVEGSIARALADHRLGRKQRARAFVSEVAQLACIAGGPLLYSTSWAPDFPATPAAAPTLWFALTVREVSAGKQPFLWR